MAFIRTIGEDEATGDAQELYAQAANTHGYVPNMVRAFSHRPQVMAAWGALLGSIKGDMDARRYELVTLAAARALRSSYCALAHGSVLLKEFYGAQALASLAGDYRLADLDEVDKCIMQFAEQVVRDAPAVTRADVETLRAHGLSDKEIFDIAAAAVRCFFSKTLDALGVLPDAAYNELDDELRRVLTVGRPIDGTRGYDAQTG